MWNARRTDATPFLREYEALLQEYGTDYNEVQHANVDARVLGEFYSDGQYECHEFENVQTFDWSGCRGRLLSSSYVPTEGDPRYDAMLRDLQRIYERHRQDGCVRFEYDTHVYFGQVHV
jgi:hypothetical protein